MQAWWLRAAATWAMVVCWLLGDGVSGHVHTPVASTAYAEQNPLEGMPRLYGLNKLGGPGCPYTASWLVHLDLYRSVKYWIDITKMEAASFTMFEKSKMAFQLKDHNAYYVHHMSSYEHTNHKLHGFEVAHNKSITLARAAVKGECGGLEPFQRSPYVAFVPFYGGRPPNVTKDLAVKSLGQGNSLVDASTKALQALATTCSCLKYFGNVVVGVARDEDRVLMTETIQALDETIGKRINIVHFSVHKPAYLPFHLLAWGHYFIRHHNCQRFYMPRPAVAASLDGAALVREGRQWLGFEEGEIDLSRVPTGVEELKICHPDAFQLHNGSPIQVLHQLRSAQFIHEARSFTTELLPIKFVYFSESDQIVRFDSYETLAAMSAASNATSFFSGRRKVKVTDTDPEEYMDGLNHGRQCGSPGFRLSWPESRIVHADP